jgi:hypothetical protein
MAVVWVLCSLAAGYGIMYVVPLLSSRGRTKALGEAPSQAIQLKRAGWLMACMIGGMLAKYLWDATASGSLGSPSLVELLRPLLVSPIVFGVVWTAAREQPPNLLVYVAAFQNGFFWQTIFGAAAA